MKAKRERETNGNNGTHGSCLTTEHSVYSGISVCSVFSFSLIQLSWHVTQGGKLEMQSPAAQRLAQFR